MKKFKWIFVFVLLMGKYLQAEVEQIQMRWNALTCLNTCAPLLALNLTAIKHANNIQINAHSGAVVMGWDPNYHFSYEPFRAAFAATGIYINEVRVRVRGTITHDADNFYLISNGDDARFLLLGPLHPEPGRYIPKYNLISYPLTSQMKEALLAAERNHFTVVISGPLFLPEKYPRTLISEQIKINAKENLMDERFQR